MKQNEIRLGNEKEQIKRKRDTFREIESFRERARGREREREMP